MTTLRCMMSKFINKEIIHLSVGGLPVEIHFVLDRHFNIEHLWKMCLKTEPGFLSFFPETRCQGNGPRNQISRRLPH